MRLKKKNVRYVIEAEWSRNRKVHYRFVTKNPHAWAGLNSIVFTDGSSLDVSMRPCKPLERVEEIKSVYSILFEKLKYSPLCQKGIISALDIK